MPWRWPAPRFGLRTLLLGVTLCAVLFGVLFWTPYNRRARLNSAARSRIDPYELKMAGNGDAAKAPPEVVAILGDSRMKHWGPVRTADFLSKSQLASYGTDRVLRIWDVETGKQTSQVETQCATLCGPAACAYFIDAQGKLARWNAATGKVTTIELPLESPLALIQANPAGTHLISWRPMGSGSELDVWEITTGKKLRTIAHPSSPAHVALSNSATMLAMTYRDRAMIVGIPGDEPSKQIGPLNLGGGMTSSAYYVTFTPDDKRLVIAGAGEELFQFDTATGRELPRIDGTNGNVSRILFPEKNRVMRVSSGSFLYDFVLSDDKWKLFHTAETPDSGEFIEGYGWQAKVFHGNSVFLIRKDRPFRVAGGLPESLTAMDFSPAGDWLATGSQSGEITLWHTGTWTKGLSWKGHTEQIRSLQFSHDGKILAALAEDGYAVFWDPTSGEEIRSLKRWLSRKDLAFSRDDEWLVTTPVGGTEMQIFEVATGEPLFTLPERARGGMAFSPDRKLLAGAAGKNTLNIWDIEKRAVVARMGKSTILDLDIAFHPDGKRVLTAGNGDCVRVWDLASQKEIITLDDPASTARPIRIALNGSGTLVASAHNDGAARLWDLETGRLLEVFQVSPTKGSVNDVSFSPDGAYLATLNGNGTVYVLSLDGIGK